MIRKFKTTIEIDVEVEYSHQKRVPDSSSGPGQREAIVIEYVFAGETEIPPEAYKHVEDRLIKEAWEDYRV